MNLLPLKESAVLLGIAKITLYRAVEKKEIPYYRPFGGKIFFDQDELFEWIKKSKNR